MYKLLNIRTLLLAGFFIVSCTEDMDTFEPSLDNESKQINYPPKADFQYTDELDRIKLVSTAIDRNDNILHHQWSSHSSHVSVQKFDSVSAYVSLPQITKSSIASIILKVSDEEFSDTISKSIDLPPLTLARKWGLGKKVEYEFSVESDHDWFIDQMNTGDFSKINCGPTVATMAVRWVIPEFKYQPDHARSIFRSTGGWWQTNDVIRFLNLYSINNIVVSLEDDNISLVDELEKEHIIILCLDMSFISEGKYETWRTGRFYKVNRDRWGHYLILKGYKIVDSQIFYETYDSFTFGATYDDGSPKGKDRYYRKDEIDKAINQWWRHAIIVSKNELKDTRGLDIDNIHHKKGQ